MSVEGLVFIQAAPHVYRGILNQDVNKPSYIYAVISDYGNGVAGFNGWVGVRDIFLWSVELWEPIGKLKPCLQYRDADGNNFFHHLFKIKNLQKDCLMPVSRILILNEVSPFEKNNVGRMAVDEKRTDNIVKDIARFYLKNKLIQKLDLPIELRVKIFSFFS